YVDMGNLMISEGEGRRLRNVEHFTPVFITYPQQPGLAQSSVQVNWGRDRRNAVFGQHDHPRAIPLGIGDDVARNGVDLFKDFCDARIVGSVALQIVVEMGEVDQRQGWRPRPSDMQRSIGDPTGGDNGRSWSPELE